jgi:hypothetical protein
MSTITLDTDLVKQVERVAKHQETAVETLVHQAVTEYLERLRDEKLELEAKAFEKIHTNLLRQYSNQFVAMHDGQVIDHDADFEPLFLRIQKQFQDVPVLIRAVRPEPILELRGPRLRLAKREQ